MRQSLSRIFLSSMSQHWIWVALAGLSLGFSVALNLYLIVLPIVAVFVFISILSWPKRESINRSFLIFAVCAYVLLHGVWPQYSAYKLPFLPAIQPHRIAYAFFMALVISELLICKHGVSEFIDRLKIAKKESICLVAMLIFSLTSSLAGEDPATSSLNLLRGYVSHVMVFFGVLLAVRNIDDLSRVIKYIVFAAVVVSLFAIFESIKRKNIFLEYFPVSTDYAVWATLDRSRNGEYRAQATFDSPLLLVDYLVYVFPFSLWCILQKSIISKVLGVFGGILIPLALIKTGSRSPVIALSVEVWAIFIAWQISNIGRKTASYVSWSSLLISLLILLSVIVAKEFLLEQIVFGTREESQSAGARLVMVTQAFDMLISGDVFGRGYGLGAKAIDIPIYTPIGLIYVLDNYFVTLFADGGALSILSFIAFLFFVVNKILKISIRGSAEEIIASYFLLASFSGFLVVKMISSQIGVFPLFYIVTAAVVVIENQVKERELK